MKNRHLLICLSGLILSSAAASLATATPVYQSDHVPIVTQSTPQRKLVEGRDYELTSDRKGLSGWMAEDLAIVDFTQDPVLSKLKYIGKNAFMMRTSVQSVVLPETLTRIGERAFYYSGLKEITLPKNLESLGEADGKMTNPFAGSLSFTKIHLSAENTNFKLIDGVLFLGDGKELLVYPTGLSTSSYTIPDKVKRLAVNSFAGAMVKEIVCAPSLREIGSMAFEDAELLEKITLNEGLQTIGWAAFKNTKISTLALPKSLQIKSSAGVYENPFIGMASLSSFTLADGGNFILKDKALYLASGDVLIALPPKSGHTSYALGVQPTELAQGAFAYHQTLESFQSVHHVRIPLRAFDNCTKLRKVELQSGTPFIASQAFVDCNALESLTLGAPFVPILEDVDALSTLSADRFVLHIPSSLEVEAFKSNVHWQLLLSKMKVKSDAPAIPGVVLHHGELHALGANFSAETFRSSAPLVALLTDNGDQVVGNVVGTTSIYLGKEGSGSLLFVEVAPQELGMLAEPWLDRSERSLAVIKQYEKNVAHRKVVKSEPQFGGQMFTFADEARPGVSVTYLFFGDVATEYTTMVFDSKEVYAAHKMASYLMERYVPATGTDVDGETFDGFIRPDGVGYEYRELNISEDVAPVVNVAYFFSDEYTYKANPLSNAPIIDSRETDLRVWGDQLLLPQDAVSVALYRFDGTLIFHTSHGLNSSLSLTSLLPGAYLAIVYRAGQIAPLTLKLMR